MEISSTQVLLKNNYNNIVQMYNQGIAWKDIANHYKCSMQSLDWFFRKNNIKKNRRDKYYGKHTELFGEQIEKLFKEGLLVTEIADQLGISRYVISEILKDRGYTIENKSVDKHYEYIVHESEVVQLYISGASVKTLAKQFDVCPTLILRTLHANNVQLRKMGTHTVNEHFFDNIDTEDKAYILGLFLADASMNATNWDVKICLQERDGYILERIKNVMKYSGPIGLIPARKSTHQNQRRLQIYSKKMFAQLEDKGCVRRKSWHLRYPSGKIPNNLFPHFIRGYLDGDGSISHSSKMQSKNKNTPKSSNVSLSSTYQFLQEINSDIVKCVNVHPLIIKKKNDISGVWKLCKKDEQKLFLDWLYSYLTPSSLYLTRKYEKYRFIFYCEGGVNS